MRKLLVMVCCALMALASCTDKKAQERATAQTDSLNQVVAQREAEINDMLGTLNEIQEGFNAINEAEGLVNIAKTGEGTNRSKQLKENVALIAKRMEENRALIEKPEEASGQRQREDGSTGEDHREHDEATGS